MGRAGHITLQDDALPPLFHHRVWDGHGREEGLGVGVKRILVKLGAAGELDNFAQVHHCHPIADMAHHAQVVSDEEVGHVELGLQIFQEVNDLSLDGDVH